MLEQHAVVDVATPIYYFSGQIVLIGETRGTLACKERKKKEGKKRRAMRKNRRLRSNEQRTRDRTETGSRDRETTRDKK